MGHSSSQLIANVNLETKSNGSFVAKIDKASSLPGFSLTLQATGEDVLTRYDSLDFSLLCNLLGSEGLVLIFQMC